MGKMGAYVGYYTEGDWLESVGPAYVDYGIVQ